MEAELFHSDAQTDRQTDRQTNRHVMKLIFAFLNFAKTSKNWRIKICWDVILCRLGLLDTEDGGTTPPPLEMSVIFQVDEAQYSTEY